MPHSRHQRNHRQDDVRNNNPNAHAAQEREVAPAGADCAVLAVNQPARENDNAEVRLQRCCTPESCRFPEEKIDLEDPYHAVKVVCNNEACQEGSWMHKDCFEEFEQSVLIYLRSCGRARSWSEKQRLQNLWTKKGYDLAFKACDCKCGRGHLRKDLNYIPPPFSAKKQKRHKKKNDKPMPVVSTTQKSNSHSCQISQPTGNNPQTTTHAGNNHGHQNSTQSGRNLLSMQKGKKPTITTKSLVQKTDNSHFQHQGALDNLSVSSSTATNSTNTFANNFNSHLILGVLPGMGNPQLRLRTNSVSSTCSAGSHSSSSSSSIPGSAGSASPISSSPVSGDGNMFFKSRKSSDASSDSAPSQNGFRQRIDLSAFAALPRNKQNAYHIHMEDPNILAHALSFCVFGTPKVLSVAEVAAEAGNCDTETRNFVLGNLLNKKMYNTRCSLCKTVLPVFDRFPLVDGTFFLSPQSYDEAAIQVIWDGRLQFLNAVCLSCLEGHGDIRCASCKVPWDGRNLVIGSMYTYDIFAAAPCCQKRLTCKCCRRAVVDITKGLDFYSQYSHMIICPYCKANDYHFIHSLTETFLLSEELAAFSGPICH